MSSLLLLRAVVISSVLHNGASELVQNNNTDTVAALGYITNIMYQRPTDSNKLHYNASKQQRPLYRKNCNTGLVVHKI